MGEQKQTEALAESNGSIDSITDDFIVFKDISCVGADDNVFEKYDVLFLRREPAILNRAEKLWPGQVMVEARKPHHKVLYKNPQFFIPSLALYCNLLDILYSQSGNDDVEAILEGFEEVGHAITDTLGDYHPDNNLITHYPKKGYETQKNPIELVTPGMHETYMNNKPTEAYRVNLSGLPIEKAQSLVIRFPSISFSESHFFGLFSEMPYIFISKSGCILDVTPASPRYTVRDVTPGVSCNFYGFLMVSENKPKS